MGVGPDRALVIDDGSLGGLLGVWTASREAALEDQPEPVLLFPVTGRAREDVRRGLVEQHASMCGIESVITTPPIGVPLGADAGALDCLVLTHAAMTGASMGTGRIIWPVHLSQLERAGESAEELTRIANACDRAMLAGALASVDASGDGVRIELPYADLSDEQIADLARDTMAPVDAAWWCEGEPGPTGRRCGTCPACRHWAKLLGLAVTEEAPMPSVVTRAIDPSRIAPRPD